MNGGLVRSSLFLPLFAFPGAFILLTGITESGTSVMLCVAVALIGMAEAAIFPVLSTWAQRLQYARPSQNYAGWGLGANYRIHGRPLICGRNPEGFASY